MCSYVIEHCPSPFMASGWEVGCGDYYNANYGNVMTGQGLKDLDTTHILRRSYEYHFLTRRETEDITRHSNDQCALHYAIRGEGTNYVAYTDGKISLSKAGVCQWDESIDKNQGFIQKKRDKDSIAMEIESLMMMDRAEVDITPPNSPEGLAFDKNRDKIFWQAAQDPSKGSWVVAYKIYQDEHLLNTAYGTQLFLDELDLKENLPLEIRSVNAAGVESESAWIKLE